MVLKKELDKEFEKVEAMGSDNNSEGVSATKTILAEDQKKEVERKVREEEYLKGLRRRKDIYIQNLAKLLIVKLYEDDLPAHIYYEVVPTETGVVMEMNIANRLFRQAFRATGEPMYDLNAVDMFVMRAENTILEMERVNKKNARIIH